MKQIKDSYIIFLILLLMIVRPFAPGKWISSITVAGVLVAWINIISIILIDDKYSSPQKKHNRKLVVKIMCGIGIIMLFLIVLNVIVDWKWLNWLNSSISLDEFTLAALLLCFSQDAVVDIINKKILSV